MNKISLLPLLLFFCGTTMAQVSGSLMQHPDVSATQVTFVYGDDVWIAPKNGGTASRLSSPDGSESYPRFSPDGKKIAYTANYSGNSDVYVIPSNGGVPVRLTYHGMSDKVLGWTPDGKSVLFASSRESGRQRYSEFYTVPMVGGKPTKLPVPYGEYASISPDGLKIAYTDRSRVNRNWKRYRGGTAPDITLFDLNSFASENITNNMANDELPMWKEGAIYYMSDNDEHKRNNLWKYDLNTKSHTQLTHFKDFDITFPESGPSDIVFEAGGKLYLFNIATANATAMNISIISDQRGLIPEQKNVASYVQHSTISPDGNRVIVQARGELFNLPAVEGYVANVSASSGSAERKPAWSPDGNSVACWSDASGEYQLVIYDMKGTKKPRTVTNFTKGFNYNIYWSPDSKKIMYVDQSATINLIDVTSGKTTKVDHGKNMTEGPLRNFSVSWSPDSQWAAYSHDTENPATTALFLYDVANAKVTQLTSGYYSDSHPVFSSDGKHLFFFTNRTFNPVYGDLDNTFTYPNMTGIAVGTLDKKEASLISVKNDQLEDSKKEDDKKEDTKKKDAKEDKKEGDKEIPKTTIDIAGFEQRVELLDIPNGNFGGMKPLKDKLIFLRDPNAGAHSDAKNQLDFYDFKEREIKTIIKNISDFEVSADGTKILVTQEKKMAIIKPEADQKIEKTVPLDQMTMNVVPKEEWTQIFNDVWRFERDYFYDPNMHGVDWNAMKKRYGQLIEQSNSRSDVNIIIGDLIAELNASHTYNGGGDLVTAKTIKVGYLGADLAVENGHYRLKKIVSGAPWDIEVRSPLSKPGIEVSEGDYLLAVNGQPVDITKPISAAFQGLANSAVQITVNSTPSFTDAKNIVIQPLETETRLRHLAWIESNRKRVEEATDGKIGYIYVRSTGVDGQNELVRQFYAQMDKEGLIIDERFNSGGQIPDRFIELLNREPLAYWAVRDGKDWSWPPMANFGPKVMLINGFSGSGGDAFPDYFRKRNLGPLIGTRTWGGLIGISGAPSLIDNGIITMPTFRMYDQNGEWFKEGHGVDPDIEVVEDFQKLAKGIDAQLEAAIDEVLKLNNGAKKYKKPARPLYEKRN